MTIEIREYRAGDEHGILALYEVAFKLDLSLEEWRWFYRDAVIVIAEDAGRIIGHYAVQRRPFSVKGRVCAAGLVIGSMVSPEYRNVTTFLECAKYCYALCRQRGIAFVYAFPNDNVWLVRRRMLDWSALPSLISLVAAPDTVEQVDEERIDRVDEVESEVVVGSDAIAPIYPKDFLTWRIHKPGTTYPTFADRDRRGYVVLKHYKDDGHILALRAKDPQTGRRLLARALAHFVAANTKKISMWMLPRSPMFPMVTAAGLVPDSEKGKNFGFLALEDGLTETLADASAWDISMLDSDVF